MKNLINSVQLRKPNGSLFDLTHDFKFTANMGKLYPICALETIPGDKFNISAESLIRFAPMLSPVMHRIDAHIHYFFVPNRLVWEGWEDFVTTGTSGAESPVPPFFSLTSSEPSLNRSLANYLGVPIHNSANVLQVNAIPFAAYQMIWKEYFRDQNLQPVSDEDYMLIDGNNNMEYTLFNTLRSRCWQHDYFTSCLPFTQKGDEAIISMQFDDVQVQYPAAGIPGTDLGIGWSSTTFPSGATEAVSVVKGTPTSNIATDVLYADTSSLQGGTFSINEFRQAMRLQEWLERQAVGGTRYIEQIKAHFGVESSDTRLQRPEYIVGIKSPVVISEVLQNSATDPEVTPQGNMAGHGIATIAGHRGSYYCEEHGWIIGIMSVMPKTGYQQGLPRSLDYLSRNDKLEYYWPEFAHLGEQAIYNREIYADQNTANQAEVFGYLPRHTEYRLIPNRVAGDFQSSLNHWHMGRIFDTPPALNEDFVQSDPTHRIFAVTDPDVDKLYCHVLNKIKAYRLMPKYATPMT